MGEKKKFSLGNYSENLFLSYIFASEDQKLNVSDLAEVHVAFASIIEIFFFLEIIILRF